MDKDSTCLDENEVLALVQGECSPEQLARLLPHVEECEQCQDLVAVAARDQDGD